MIGMVGNHLLVNMSWSDHVLNNSNTRAPSLTDSYLQTKYNNAISYTGINLLLNSINKGS